MLRSLLFFGALAVALVAISPALGQETPRLTGPVTDLANAVDSTAGIEDAIDELERDRGIQLFVLYVDTTGDRSMSAFADDVIEFNNLGAADALLAVAIDDRTYQLWLGDLATNDVPVEEQDTILAREVEPELGNGDFAGAAIAAAAGINAAVGGNVVDGGGKGGGPPWGWIIAGALVVAGAGFGAYWMYTSWRSDRRTAEERDRQTGELARRANAALLETDDALRDAEQELGFAEAEFAPSEVVPFTEALAQARTKVKAAFAVRQKLDDAIPETPPQREAMFREIIQHCEEARGLIDEQTRRLNEIRDLEQRAPDVLQALPAQIERVEQGIPGAEQQLQQLQQFAEGSWRTVQGNIVEAQKRVAFARAQTEAGNGALAQQDRKVAAASVRAAQSALGESNTLLQAIGSLAEATREAQTKLGEQLPIAERDVRSARAALASADAPQLAAQVERAESELTEARRLATGARPDVLAAYQRAVQADAIADEVLRVSQEAAETRQREESIARAAVSSADASYRRASDFVLSRRSGGIGREARTRLVEAERQLDQARDLIEDDPRRATEQAQKAQRLADDAVRLGQDDVGSSGRPGRGGDLGLGMVLGGILLGGGGGGGFGGTRWGSPGRGGGGGFSIPGGGGGGRSRGGRW